MKAQPATIELAPGYRVSRLTKGNWQIAERHGPMVEPALAIEGMRGYVDASITAVVLRWVLDRPGVASAIVGARTDAHLADLLTVATVRLDAARRVTVTAWSAILTAGTVR